MADTTGNQTALLKETYTKDVVNEILYEDNPAYKLVPKLMDFKGLDYYRVPLVIAMNGATASNFTRAQVNAFASSTASRQFLVNKLRTNALGYLSDEVYRTSIGNDAAFLEASKLSVKGVVYKLGRDISIAMYRDGWGTRGQIAVGSSITGLTLTLSRASDSFNFDIGDRLQVNTNKGDAPKAYGASGLPLVITGVDRDLGVLTFASNVNDASTGVPTIAAGDFIYIDGDVVASTRTKLTGFDGWLPTVAPGGADSFFGLNRSQDVQKLAGGRIDGTQSSIVENMNRAVIKASQIGGKTSHILVSFDTWNDFVNSQESKVRIMEHTLNSVGFPSAKIITPNGGAATVVMDINCPSDRMYALQLDTWKLHTLGDAVNQTGSDGVGDGLEMLRSYNSPDWELRYSFSGGLTCSAPGWNVVVSL